VIVLNHLSYAILGWNQLPSTPRISSQSETCNDDAISPILRSDGFRSHSFNAADVRPIKVAHLSASASCERPRPYVAPESVPQMTQSKRSFCFTFIRRLSQRRQKVHGHKYQCAG